MVLVCVSHNSSGMREPVSLTLFLSDQMIINAMLIQVLKESDSLVSVLFLCHSN